MKKGIFIYNPNSGDRSIPRKLDYIMERFQEHGILIQPFRLMKSRKIDFVDELKVGKYDFAVVSGGDGSVNSVVNALLKNKLDIPLGLIPAGTCNDFARCLEIPSDLEKSINLILEDNIVKVDVGLVNEETYFLSTFAGGLFVGASFNTHNELKTNFGPFAYYLKALTELANIKSFKLKIVADGVVYEEDSLLFLVLNGKHAAGLSNLSKFASFSDGIMDILIIKECRPIDLAALMFKVLSNDVLNDNHVRIIRAKECIIEGSMDVALSVDGEKSDKLPSKVQFINKVLKVFAK